MESTSYKNKREKGMSIEDRPKEVDDRNIPFHFEGDTVYSVSGDNTVWLSLIERTSRKQFMIPMGRRTTQCVHRGLKQLLKEIPVIRSITFDNGSEFSKSDKIRKLIRKVTPNAMLYYAHPYRSCERGSNERNHYEVEDKPLILRRFSKEELQAAVAHVNRKPRKILNFKSSETLWNELYAEYKRTL